MIHLPETIAGRTVRPFPLFLSLACLVIVYGLLVREEDAGQLLDGGSLFALGVAVAAVAATTLLWWGWWLQSTSALAWGLLLGAVTFVGRGVFVALDRGLVTSSLISLLIGGCAGWSFLIAIRADDV